MLRLKTLETLATKKIDQFIQSLPETSIHLSSTELDEAKKFLGENDFPTTRDEAWKYTRVAKIANIRARENARMVSEMDLQSYVLEGSSHTCILVNGQVAQIIPSANDLSGLHFTLFSELSQNELTKFNLTEAPSDVFDALNSACLNEGIWIKVDQNVVISKPIVLVHILSGEQSVYHSRIRIELGKHSQMELIQKYVNLDAEKSYGNIKTEIHLADGSSLEFHKLQHGLKTNYIITRETVVQSASSKLTIHTHTSDSNFVRNDSTIRVQGSNAETNLFGSYLLNGNEHVDNHTCIDHLAPHCQSNELYKGVIGGKSTGVFNGKVFVRQNAQKINAFQSNANILTSDLATMNSKPELEIYADDVKCSHGSTTGQLDEAAVFYLRARGISEKGAKNLLIQAFLEDVFAKTENNVVKQILETAMNSYFESYKD